MRSSSEWKETTDSRPPSRQDALGGEQSRCKLVQFLVHEQPQRLEGARRRMDRARLAVHDAADDVGERAGGEDRIFLPLGDDGARDRARMPLLAQKENDIGEIAFGNFRDHIRGARSVGAHAHVERAVLAEGEAALGLIELHRRDAEIEHDAVDRLIPALPRDLIERGEARLHELEPAFRAFDKTRAMRDRALVAVDADHAAIGGVEHHARVAAGAEGAVDIDAAVLEIEEAERGRTEHGSVTSQSASDRPVSRRRCPSSLPCSARFCRHALDAQTLSQLAHRSRGLRELLAQAVGRPDLKFVSEADERRRPP